MATSPVVKGALGDLLYGIKIFADPSVEPGSIEIRDGEVTHADPYLVDCLKQIDPKDYAKFFIVAGIKIIDRRVV